jgi:MoaA/NifB/PqqE/SkfB family radical SAM enzyme
MTFDSQKVGEKSKALDFMDEKRVIIPYLKNREKGFCNPCTVEIHLTNRCQLDCVFCYYKNRNNNCFIPVEQANHLIDELYDMGVETLIISGGGEPLIHPNIKEILFSIFSRKIPVGINTNGLALDPEIMSHLIECDWVKISVDAASSSCYSSMKKCSEDTFNKLISNIKSLIRIRNKFNTKLKIQIGFLVNTYNWHEIIPFLKMCMKLKLNPELDSIIFRPVVGNAFEVPYLKIQKLVDKNSDFLNNNPFKNIILFEYAARCQDIVSSTPKGACKMVSLVSCIGADSEVYPCCQLALKEQFAMGSLKKSSFQSIWKDAQSNFINNKMKISNHPPCRYRKMNFIIDDFCSKKIIDVQTIKEKWKDTPIYV